MKILNFAFFLTLLIFLYSCNTQENKEKVNDQRMVLSNGFIVIDTFANGAPKTTYQRNTIDTNKTMVEVYHANGAMNMKGEVVNEKREGQWLVWDENHNLISMGTYKNGLEDGEKTVWYSNGVKYYEGNFILGKKTGIWKFYNQDGTLAEEKKFEEN